MAIRKKAKKPTKTKGPKEIAFDYIKSNQFRVVNGDGAFGGLSPTGRDIHMAVYSERRAIPTKTVHPVTADGTLGPEFLSRRQVRSAFVRELEVDIVLDLPTAVTVLTWLTDKIQQCAKSQGVTPTMLKGMLAQSAASRKTD